MKLSEAIRLGAMLKPQVFGGLYAAKPRGILGLTEERLGTCALGAAFEAAGCPAIMPIMGIPVIAMRDGPSSAQSVLVPEEWAFMAVEAICPVCSVGLKVARIIAHLNDDHRWTRERIADWVASVEAAQETNQPASVAAVARTVDEGKEPQRA